MTKVLRVRDEIHQQAKLTAAMYGMSLREFTEKALMKVVAPSVRQLVDTKEPYHATQGGENDD